MMDRRTFNKLASLAAIGALADKAEFEAEQTAAPLPATGSAGEVVLEDKELLVGFDTASGALIRLQRKSTRWIIERRPELGVSFRLLAPMQQRRDNFILGEKQRATKVKKISERQLSIEWRNLASEHGGTLPITLVGTVTLQNGGLTFDSTIINDSSLVVETIDYPYLGDLHPPTPGERMTSEHMWYGNLVGDELRPRFHNEKGYWGVDVATKTIASKQSLFCLIQSPDQGLYVEMHDAVPQYLLEFTFVQHPGVLQSIDETVSQQDEISGLPVHLEFRTCHFVFAHPHSTVNLIPVVLRPYNGDWHAGVDLYKQWRTTWFKQTYVAGWVKDVHSWQQLQINAPEEDYSIPYRDLGKYVAECAKNGVTAIQLVGWNRGGQDRGNPSQDIDPRLGTRQELKDAISQAQAIGVKIILFGKFDWADLTTKWYKTELYKYACTDPYGIPYQHQGYSYTTPTQLARINNRRFAVMDFCAPAYRDIATHEFQKLLDFGSAGWLFDEVCHHGPADYSFSPDHGYTPPGYVYAGDIPMSKQLRAAADKVNPDFIFSGEAPQDWLMQYYPLSYFRIQGDSRPVCRYIDPLAPLMVSVTGFDDREMLNRILLYRYIISYEPYNFKGRLTDFPLTLAYGKKIDALRRKYKPWLWDAEFCDTQGASVSADGAHRYTVFRTAEGKRAVVVVNEEFSNDISITLELPNPGSLVTATPEQPEAQPTSGATRIPARSAIVVMEQ
jgi:Domain of unknown function (DUF6259)